MSGCLAEALNMDVQIPHSNAMLLDVLLTLLNGCAADEKQRPAGPVSQQQHALQLLLRHAVIIADIGVFNNVQRLTEPAVQATSGKLLRAAGLEMRMGSHC
jgi:hypothetical protein